MGHLLSPTRYEFLFFFLFSGLFVVDLIVGNFPAVSKLQFSLGILVLLNNNNKKKDSKYLTDGQNLQNLVHHICMLLLRIAFGE